MSAACVLSLVPVRRSRFLRLPFRKNNMGFTKEQLLLRLKELQIEFSQYEHPAVLTVEAQANYVGDKGGGLSKNLFLKDKKSRFYIVSALADTNVDMKVLSQRLGLGKGGIRMAPEEVLGEILQSFCSIIDVVSSSADGTPYFRQVPLGCVTPFALVNDSARHVSLLLDKRFKTQEYCFFHPLSNDMSIALNACNLDKFLKSIGREPSYVGLEANPPVGKDQPPDLAAFVPSGSTILPNPSENAAHSQVPSESSISANKNSTAPTGKSLKLNDRAQNFKDKTADAAHKPSAFSDAGLFVEEILTRTSLLLLKEITDDTIKQHGENLGTVVADKLRKCLSSDLTSIAMMFKNRVYAEGFQAAAHHYR